MVQVIPDGGSIENFQGQPGYIVLFVDANDAPPCSVQIPEEDLNELVERKDLRSVAYSRVVRLLAEEFVRCKAAGDDERLVSVCLGILWTAFNHPQDTGMRRMVARMMREGRVPHITWRCNVQGFGFGVGEGYIDTQEMVNASPFGATLTIERDESESRQN